MKYQIARQDGVKSLCVVLPTSDGQSEMFVATSTNPCWEDILAAVLDGDEVEVRELLDIPTAINRAFQQVTERVSLRDGVVYFDADAVHNSLAQAISRAESSEGIRGLALFMEKAYSNPRAHSRDNLFDWLGTHDFVITPEGDLVGYKGVTNDLTSCTSGPGIVNGVEVSGHLDNSPGNVLEMARSKVEHNPSRGCSSGLHVGTWDYASTFGPRTMRVIVNPRDVVSVPTDCSWAKMRVCRYTVDEEVYQENVDFLYEEDESDADEDWYF